MCGICGIIPLSNDVTPDQIYKVMLHLLDGNETRGRDATGTASWDVEKPDVLICKQAETATIFNKHLLPEHIIGPTIGHCRAKTKGDPSDPENNHPMFGDKYCIVHNGMVHSMKNIDTYKYKGQCDTEVLLSYFETHGIKEAIPMIDGSAAVAIISPLDKMFYLYRHTSPLVVTLFPKTALVFSSLEYPLKKVADILNVPKVWGLFTPQSTADFDEGTLFSLNMKTFEVKVETIKVESKITGNIRYGV